MADRTDHELLAEYACSASEAAFTQLVARYVNLVYSTALRFTANPHQTEEITQAVFVILARKAGTLSPRVVLSGWLYQVTRHAAANLVRGEIRRQQREQEAYMQTTSPEPDPVAWEQLAPLLDAAMGQLGETDRNAVVLSFFENRTAAEVAARLHLSESAAHKRVQRALEKLRKFFARHGVASTAAGLAGTISTHSLQVAPATLAQSVAAVALTQGAAASASTLTLIEGALKIMAWTKTQTVVGAGLGVLLLAGTATVGINKYNAHQAAFYSWRHPDPDWQTLARTQPQVTILPTKYAYPVYGLVMAGDGRWVGIRATVTDLARTAYRWPAGRIYFPAGEPTNRYDFASTLPQGTEAALQKKIGSQLGLVGRHETRDTEVFLLKVRRPGALTPHNPKSDAWDRRDVVKGRIVCMGEPLSATPPAAPFGLTKYLELFLKMPVIDETGLAGKYDIDLNWKEDPQDPNHEAMKAALGDQLGLELVPANRPIEMLVMEKAK